MFSEFQSHIINCKIRKLNEITLKSPYGGKILRLWRPIIAPHQDKMIFGAAVYQAALNFLSDPIVSFLTIYFSLLAEANNNSRNTASNLQQQKTRWANPWVLIPKYLEYSKMFNKYLLNKVKIIKLQRRKLVELFNQ